MAEGGGNWWDSWLESAKTTSTNVFEFMKKDLDEFSQTVTHETKSVVSNAAEALKEKLKIDSSESAANKVKRSVSSFLGTVSEALTPTKEENDDEVCIIHNDEPVIMDRLQAQLYALQNDPKTYLEDPKDAREDYEEWLQSFDLEKRSTELSDIMINNAEVQELYSKLVPAEVSHVLFWNRYFFKVCQLLLNEERKRVIMERVAQPAIPDDVVWDDVDEDATIPKEEDMPDHVADRLLEEYDKECRSRKRSSKDMSQKSPLSISSAHKFDAAGDYIANSTKTCPETLPEIISDQKTNLASKVHPAKLGSTAVSNVESHSDDATAELPTALSPKESESSAMSIVSSENVTDGESFSAISATTSPEDTNSLAEVSDPQLVTREKGGFVVVGPGASNRTSPASSNREGSNDDEWEKDLELEVTEEEAKKAKDVGKVMAASMLAEGGPGAAEEEWEKWE